MKKTSKSIQEARKKEEERLKGFFKGFLILISLVAIGLFALYQYLHYKEGFTIYFNNYNIQDEYARFLVETNDNFIDKMLMFEDIVREKEDYTEYSDEDKEILKNIILSENSILSRLNNTKPNKEKNADYEDLFDNMTYAYALYIQGQLMKMEYILQTKDGLDIERYTLGESITNLIGNFIIEYAAIANEVRNTSYESNYSVLDGLEYNLGTANAKNIERDEDGKIIINDSDTYLYLPENEEYSTISSEDDKGNIEETNINDTVEDFVKDFKDIQ